MLQSVCIFTEPVCFFLLINISKDPPSTMVSLLFQRKINLNSFHVQLFFPEKCSKYVLQITLRIVYMCQVVNKIIIRTTDEIHDTSDKLNCLFFFYISDSLLYES